MKASVTPKVILSALLFFTALLPATIQAQDSLVLTNGQRQEAQILGVADGRVRVKKGPVESSLPLEQVASVRMAPPKAFEDAMTAWKTGDAAKTLVPLKSVISTFSGLPVSWAERASALLGEVLLASGDIPGAEAAFASFQKSYPKATGLAQVGLARLAVEKKNYDEAAAKLAPIVAAARKTIMAESGRSAELGQACYLMGNVLESQGKYPEAMEHYLLAVTVFYEDPATVSRAQARADALSKEKNAAVP